MCGCMFFTLSFMDVIIRTLFSEKQTRMRNNNIFFSLTLQFNVAAARQLPSSRHSGVDCWYPFFNSGCYITSSDMSKCAYVFESDKHHMPLCGVRGPSAVSARKYVNKEYAFFVLMEMCMMYVYMIFSATWTTLVLPMSQLLRECSALFKSCTLQRRGGGEYPSAQATLSLSLSLTHSLSPLSPLRSGYHTS